MSHTNGSGLPHLSTDPVKSPNGDVVEVVASPVSPLRNDTPGSRKPSNGSVSVGVRKPSKREKSHNAGPNRPVPTPQARTRTVSPTFHDIVKKFNQVDDGIVPTRSSSNMRSASPTPIGLRKTSEGGRSNTGVTSIPMWRPTGGPPPNSGLRQRANTIKPVTRHYDEIKSRPRTSHSKTKSIDRDGPEIASTDPSESVPRTNGTDGKVGSRIPRKSLHSNVSPPRENRNTVSSGLRPAPRPSRSTPQLNAAARLAAAKQSNEAKRNGRSSPSLAAYINAPQKSPPPPLRSSRPRHSVTSKKPTRPSERQSGLRNKFLGANDEEESKPKKKIPELGSVDFAARRKMIASAFNDKMDKERAEEQLAEEKKRQKALEESKTDSSNDLDQEDTPVITNILKIYDDDDDEEESEPKQEPKQEERKRPKALNIGADRRNGMAVGLGLDFGPMSAKKSPSAAAFASSPKLPKEYRRHSSAPLSPRYPSILESYQMTSLTVQSPEDLQSPRSAIPSQGALLSPKNLPKVVLQPVDQNAEKPSWEKAAEEEAKKRKTIEEQREIVIKNRLSLPPSPETKSSEFKAPESEQGHKRQSSLTSSPNLAPPDSLGTILWTHRPKSSAGESMISHFYKEQEELARERTQKQLENSARSHSEDNTYVPPSPRSAGFVILEGTFRYGDKSLDPSDYWTPVPSQSEFGGRSNRSSVVSTRTNDIKEKDIPDVPPIPANFMKIMDRTRPIADGPPPTPPPKDFRFPSPKPQLPPELPPQLPLKPYEMPSRIEIRRSSLPASLGHPSPAMFPPQDFTEQVSPPSKESDNRSENNTLEVPSSSRSSTYSEEEQTTDSTPIYSVLSPDSSVLAGNSSFVSSKENQTPEQKMLSRRRHLLKELVDTEKAFFQDMTVTEEIYKGTADACEEITADDVRAVFGNIDAVVGFSRTFIDTLKAAVSSVYVPVRALNRSGSTPAGSRVGSRANSSCVSLTTLGSSSMDLEMNEEEKDRRTWVGEAFGQALPRMEKIYGDYCKNHEAAVGRLQQLEKVKGIAIWLKECKEVADDLTNAWSLDALLIKPVQRILKYPLLLDQILECTPQDHPDFTAIDLAAREIKVATERINESKKRKDLMDKLVGPRKRADTRHGFSKGISRRAEKLRQTVGLSEQYVDEKYEEACARFQSQFFQIQVIMRDIEMYMEELEKQIGQFHELAFKFEEYATCLDTKFKDYIVRWKDFTSRANDMLVVALPEHKKRVKHHCILPLEKIMKISEQPQKVMAKRNKKAVDYGRYRAIKDKGDKVDKRTQELADAYSAINDTLLDELPKLYSLNEKLVRAVLANFTGLVSFWEKEWEGQMEGLLDPLDIPSNFSDIIEVYKGDFKFDPIMASFHILNIQHSVMWQMNGISGNVPDTRTTTGTSEFSNAITRAFPSGASKTEKRLSGGLMAAMAPGLPIVPSQGNSPTSTPRDRASSTAAVPTQTAMEKRPVAIRAMSANTSARPRTSSGSGSFSNFSDELSIPDLPNGQIYPLSNPSTRPNSSAGLSAAGLSDTTSMGYKVLWLCASIYAYQSSSSANQKRDLGFSYLTYEQGEVFDVIGVKGEYWLAKNQDDEANEFGWIWSKHFAKLAQA